MGNLVLGGPKGMGLDLMVSLLASSTLVVVIQNTEAGSVLPQPLLTANVMQ